MSAVTPEPGNAPERGARAQAIVAAARQILEAEGREALTMRRLGEAVGIRAPSLYKHFADKATVELALVELAFQEIAVTVEQAVACHGASLATVMTAYRSFALAHPHLYRLMTEGQLARHLLPAGVEERAAAPLIQVAGERNLARAAFAFAHGMTLLELDGRFPPDADIDAAWREGTRALAALALR
ncbi:MAG: WHG domain-containing protein [Thermomicrobiales bacterium]|nr:WHG domain-containing protein [Thermomicrobiales bacterium]